MSHAKQTFDLIDEILRAPFSRRGLLQTAAAAGVIGPGFGLPRLAAASQDATGQPGGTASVVVAANPASWDLTKSTWPTWEGVNYLYDRLLTLDDLEELQPGLATAWEVSADGLEYLLTLREGVTFHDGTPFNAEAVRFNIQRHLDQPDSAFYVFYEPVDRVDVVDDLTARIVLREIRPLFAYEGLAQWGSLQISPTAYAELGDRYAEHPVGTGPFKFELYEPGSVIRYVRNDDYWGGAPLLDGVEVRIIPEPSVQIIEMEAGTVDAILVEPKDVATLEERGAIIDQRVSPGTEFISLNVSKPPTSELAVRRAIAHAIDRDTIIQTVQLGFAEKSRGGVTTDSIYYADDIPMIEYDPEISGQILDEAGWVMGEDGIRARDGEPLFVRIFSTEFRDWGLHNQIIQEQLNVIGIDSEIITLEWNAYLDQWRENQGDWNVTFHQQGTQIAAVAAIQAAWIPDNFWSITQIDDATEPDLVEIGAELQALADEFRGTLDQERRQEIARQAQMIFQENQLAVWLWHRATIHAIQPRLQGYRLTHAGRIVELDKAWIE